MTWTSPEPASDSTMVLASLLPVPEMVALTGVLLAKGPRPAAGAVATAVRHAASATHIAVVGVGSVFGFGPFDEAERSGSAWRVATVHLDVRVAANATELATTSTPALAGRRVRYVESLILVARPGYRLALTHGLLAYWAVTYGILLLALVVVLSRGWVRRYRVFVNAKEKDDCEAAAPAEV